MVDLTKRTTCGQLNGPIDDGDPKLTLGHVIALLDGGMLTITIACIVEQKPSAFCPPVVEHPQPALIPQLRMCISCVEQAVPIRVNRRCAVRRFLLAIHDKSFHMLRKSISWCSTSHGTRTFGARTNPLRWLKVTDLVGEVTAK